MNFGYSWSGYTFYLFVISSALCTLVLLRGFLRCPPEINEVTNSRYSLLLDHFGSSDGIINYTKTHKNKNSMYSQVYWMILDDWPAYTVVPDPDDRTFLILIATLCKNKMTLITSRTQKEPNKAGIYTFYSAAPTMTNSRVEALGTGFQPPYITIATSFSHSMVRDDNLIQQINNANYKIHLIGDSLWSSIYSRELYVHIDTSSAYSQKSLDEYVDEKLKTKLYERDWDFLITHVNKLDHISHVYTYNSKEAVAHLQYDDRLINDSIGRMGANSLIITFGDHGSTLAEGSHGGGTKEEIESGLFTYTKKGFSFKSFLHPEDLPRKTRNLIEKLNENEDGMFKFLVRNAFYQYDIVPTMASIFNVGIPFKNIGMIIPELLHYNVNNNTFISENLYELMMDYLINFLQAYRYNEIGYKKHGEMDKQWFDMNTVYENYKEAIPNNVAKIMIAMELERKYNLAPENIKMTDDEWKEYSTIIKETVYLIKILMNSLSNHRKDFTDQWCAISMIYLYSSWIIRILGSISLALCVFIMGYIATNKKYQLISGYSFYIYFALIQIALILIVAFFYRWDGVTITLSFVLSIYSIISQIIIIYKERTDMLLYVKESPPISILLCIIIYLYTTIFVPKMSSTSIFSIIK